MERRTVFSHRAYVLAIALLAAAMLFSGCVRHHHGPSGRSGGPSYSNSKQYHNAPAPHSRPARTAPKPGPSGGPGGRR